MASTVPVVLEVGVGVAGVVAGGAAAVAPPVRPWSAGST